MFDKSVFKTGLHQLIQTIDYDAVKHANAYYLNLLRREENLLPDFCADIDAQAVIKAANDGKEEELSLTERNFIRFKRLTASNNPASPVQLLEKMNRYVRALPGDSMLKLIFAKVLMRRDMFSDAAHYLHCSILNDPENGKAYAHLGLLAALANDHGTAVRCAREALKFGEHLTNTQQKASVFTLLAMGIPSWFASLDSRPLFAPNQQFAPQDKVSNGIVVDHCPEKLSEKPIAFVACNDNYFDLYAKNLLLSLIPTKHAVTCHIHLINPDPRSIEWLTKFEKKFGVSMIVTHENLASESVGKDPSYLASNRFINLPGFMRRFERSYLVLDADSLLNNEDALEPFLNSSDNPILYFAKTGPIWDRISAPIVYLPYNDSGFAFAKKCGDYLSGVFKDPDKHGFWYIDQLALLGCFVEFQTDVNLCPAELISDINCGEDAIFWTLSNDKKHPSYLARVDKLSAEY